MRQVTLDIALIYVSVTNHSLSVVILSIGVYNVCVHRSAMVRLLCSLYGLTLIIVAFVFAVAAALTATDVAAGNSIYHQVVYSTPFSRHSCSC